MSKSIRCTVNLKNYEWHMKEINESLKVLECWTMGLKNIFIH